MTIPGTHWHSIAAQPQLATGRRTSVDQMFSKHRGVTVVRTPDRVDVTVQGGVHVQVHVDVNVNVLI